MRILIILVILAVAYFVFLRPRLASPPDSQSATTPKPTPEVSFVKRPIDQAQRVVDKLNQQQKLNNPTDEP